MVRILPTRKCRYKAALTQGLRLIVDWRGQLFRCEVALASRLLFSSDVGIILSAIGARFSKAKAMLNK
ncbi:hypothetical protein AB4428_11755, partial [Vibrio lentus]